jgi:hypothetical protein
VNVTTAGTPHEGHPASLPFIATGRSYEDHKDIRISIPPPIHWVVLFLKHVRGRERKLRGGKQVTAIWAGIVVIPRDSVISVGTRLQARRPKYPSSICSASMEKLEGTKISYPLQAIEPRFVRCPARSAVSIPTPLSLRYTVDCSLRTLCSCTSMLEEQVPGFLVYSAQYALTSARQAVVNLHKEIPSGWDFLLVPCGRMVVKTETMADRRNLSPKHGVFCYTSQSQGFSFRPRRRRGKFREKVHIGSGWSGYRQAYTWYEKGGNREMYGLLSRK